MRHEDWQFTLCAALAVLGAAICTGVGLLGGDWLLSLIGRVTG